MLGAVNDGAGPYVGIRAHARAKQPNLIWTFALAERLRAQQVAVNATNPGAAWTPGSGRARV